MMELNPESEIKDVTFDFEGAHLALCHKSQGFSANNRPQPLIVKSDEVEITKEAQEAAEKIVEDKEPSQNTTSSSQEETDELVNKNSFSEGISEVNDENEDSHKPSENNLNKTQGELMSTDVEKLEKAQADLEKMAEQLAAFEKQAEEAQIKAEKLASKVEGFEKAAQERKERLFTKAVEEFSFVTPEEKPEFVKSLIELDLVKSEIAEVVVSVLEKAQAAVDAVDGAKGSDAAEEASLEKSSSLEAKLMAKYGDKK